MKRFYSEVSTIAVDGGWQVALDGRGVKTQGGAPQIAPTQALVRALAAEWEAQGERLDPRALPLRDMTDYAIDMVAPDPGTVIDKIIAYGETDTLLYRADPDEPLFAHQHAVWEPITAAFEAEHKVVLTRVSGILHRAQDEAVLAALRERLTVFNPHALAGIEAMASLAASLITALSAVRADNDALELWRAACLEEEWQAEKWGRDYEAEDRRARREVDFLTARTMAVLAMSD